MVEVKLVFDYFDGFLGGMMMISLDVNKSFTFIKVNACLILVVFNYC
jgi:hypothetical protein